MILKFRTFFLFDIFLIIASSIVCCTSETQQKEADTLQFAYLNHNDSVGYVGMNTCKQCHQDIYDSFIQTGMGKSFGMASKERSAANFDNQKPVYDTYSDFYYYPYWDKDSMKIVEYRLNGKDTIFKRIEKVDYIIGSGQHTNSHLFNNNGYFCQVPLTFYTQKATWDLPPGFENGFNSRFNRKIGVECMACHNAVSSFEKGSENKFSKIAEGIDCERCHGPGALHVKEKMAGNRVDTSRYIDYTIVNPAKLPVDLQFDVCQRCHLQGNAVLKENKSFYDFRPGMKLSDYMTVFLPKYEGAENDFIMASHADRLKQSQCFIKSFKPNNDNKNLKSYKESLTCITCHNPHVSVKATGKEVFNNACKNCHTSSLSPLSHKKESGGELNCIACHMPKSGAIDIPHVSVTDHFIRNPVSEKEIKKLKKFIGLYAINEVNPSDDIKAKAYINQFEKFDLNPALLDSAKKYLPDNTNENIRKNFKSLVHLYFLKKDYTKIILYVSKLNRTEVLNNTLVNKTWSNDDAWTAYRIGEAYFNINKVEDAGLFYKKAVDLSSFNMEFKNKYGTSLLALGKTNEAKIVFENMLTENQEYTSALTNLGYVYLLLGNASKADHFYNEALKLDPDYEPLLLNKAGLLIYQKQYTKAIIYLNSILKKNPANQQAKKVLEELKNMN